MRPTHTLMQAFTMASPPRQRYLSFEASRRHLEQKRLSERIGKRLFSIDTKEEVEAVPPDDWFFSLFGFSESGNDPQGGDRMDWVRSHFEVQPESNELFCKENGARYDVGSFRTWSVGELRDKFKPRPVPDPTVIPTVRHVAVDDAFYLHTDPAFSQSTFMVASQFNCLEFPSPDTTPEDGITQYVYDHTQGPACAIAAAPATLYRNYFVPHFVQSSDKARDMISTTKQREVVGQTADYQINNLQPLLETLRPPQSQDLNRSQSEFVNVRNGYTFSDPSRLLALNECLRDSTTAESAYEALRVGVHMNVQIPWAHAESNPRESAQPRRLALPLANSSRKQYVTQVFCSTLSCAYSDKDDDHHVLWEPLASIILQASYEATLLVAAMQHGAKRVTVDSAGDAAENSNLPTKENSCSQRIEPARVVLCALGGGVFGNKLEWIARAMARAIVSCSYLNLDVVLTHHRTVKTPFVDMVDYYMRETAGGAAGSSAGLLP
jgi:hypothetical protein